MRIARLFSCGKTLPQSWGSIRLPSPKALAGAGVFIWAATTGVPAGAQTETVLHSFDIQHHKTDGINPGSRLFQDGTGALYGTTLSSSNGLGAVFELVQSGGVWSESVIAFLSGIPFGNGLVSDSAGNLYGATVDGGSYASGFVYELIPDGGSWTQQVLYTFGRNNSDGKGPIGELAQDGVGNLYGVTQVRPHYPRNYCGVFYELSPKGGGWTETIVYKFKKSTGCTPMGIIRDSNGAFFGTTVDGGAFHHGTVFELSQSGGTWTETVLYNFKRANGQFPSPICDLVEDSSGNLYGTTFRGGKHGFGTVFELSPGGGGWTETDLYHFKGGSADGAGPQGGVHLDASGAIFGTTAEGGASGNGTVYKLAQSGGVWKETVLHSFAGTGDGLVPAASVVEDQNGTLYGTTLDGGSDTVDCFQGCGTVFEVTQ